MYSKLTQIIIDFESDKFLHNFLDDVKKGIEWSKFKPKNLSMTTREEFPDE